MAERLLIPSIEQRLAGFVEVTRRNLSGYSVSPDEKPAPAITLSREFGCEGYIVAEKLKEILDSRTKAQWQVMDKALLAKVAEDHQLSEEIFHSLGKRNSFIDDMISTFSPQWKTDKDYYRLLCKQIVALAEQGNVILVGRGGAIVTRNMPNCYHFRLVAPLPFKIRSIAERTGLSKEESESLILRKQKEREGFIRDFLGEEIADPLHYHLVFNNEKNRAEKIALIIADYILSSR